MGRIQTSWEIAKRSWAVLRSDKTLAWFPVFSFLGSVVVVAAVGGLIWAAGIDDSANGDALQPLGYVLIVFGYLGLAFVQTYFLAALVAGADMRLRGGDPPCAARSTSPTRGCTGCCRGRSCRRPCRSCSAIARALRDHRPDRRRPRRAWPGTSSRS